MKTRPRLSLLTIPTFLALQSGGVPFAAAAEEASLPKLAPLGYVEAGYTYNFNDPSNALNNFRGFDNRHNTFTLSNVALGGTFDWKNIVGKLVLQVGHTPNTYYAAEPSRAGAGGASSTDASTWKYIQEALVGYKLPWVRGLSAQMGVFLSPIGIEGMAVKDNWNWSRSNLFFGLPFYHTGLRATYEATSRLTLSAAVLNGWNSVVDNNKGKSVMVQGVYKIPDKLTLSFLYMGGVERAQGAAEGQAFRHLFDTYLQVDATKWLSVAGQANTGFEQNHFGRSSWRAIALYARARPHEKAAVALRFDRFFERVARSEDGEAAPIFWAVPWMSSFTATAELVPQPNLSVRAEYRHDMAAGNAFFRGAVAGDGSTGRPFEPNASTQDTVTLGATAWF